MKAFLFTLTVSLLIGASHAAVEGAETLSQSEKAKLAKDVKDVFKAKCVKCHGPEGVREIEGPNGEFDFVLDLERLASDPTKVVRGDPNESKLYNMVFDLIMPDENAGEDPLPDNEIESIRRWILAGAPTEEGRDAAMRYHCPATKKFDSKRVFTPEQLKLGQFSTRVEELPKGIFLERCAFSQSAGKVTCNRHKVDRVEFDANLKVRKFYVFDSQLNFQIFPDLSSLEDNGRGSIQYGRCEFESPR